MPYIKQEEREMVDHLVDGLAWMVYETKGELKAGWLNYILFAFCKKYLKPSYKEYRNYIGELNECIAEIRRRILAPYEDEKIEENGDVIG